MRTQCSGTLRGRHVVCAVTQGVEREPRGRRPAKWTRTGSSKVLKPDTSEPTSKAAMFHKLTRVRCRRDDQGALVYRPSGWQHTQRSRRDWSACGETGTLPTPSAKSVQQSSMFTKKQAPVQSHQPPAECETMLALVARPFRAAAAELILSKYLKPESAMWSSRLRLAGAVPSMHTNATVDGSARPRCSCSEGTATSRKVIMGRSVSKIVAGGSGGDPSPVDGRPRL